ncbi:hypothetical protein [Nocardiopsis aegyptia]|uniref:Sugar phosphate isomerase/epimerase n=1 Tax=Nocardiopsis aegyptia TaxID=220378 RepID=A0A7Z0EMB9_9ACTN|nr:hypothetical protein [Nocardiopsis aegyptia]NYJ34762.1 sugar phosphate isomerase/epimerase [Nocardiopsis aegyptia]
MRGHWTLLTSAGLAIAVVSALTGCTGGSERECEEALTAAAVSVEGVAAVEFTCEMSLTHSSQKGSVTISGTTEPEVTAVMEEVLRAFAASADLDDSLTLYVDYENEDGTATAHPSRVGFNGNPRVSQIREHYGITPG